MDRTFESGGGSTSVMNVYAIVQLLRHSLGRFLSRRLLTNIRSIYYLPGDVIGSLIERRNELMPPRHLRHIIGGDGRDFETLGEEFFQYFVDLGKLKPSDNVLDVGCGIGRMALPLTRYLNDGRYEGFDIIASGINWCRRNITARYPQFRFHYADIYNKRYNPRGKGKASEYQFPYQGGFFDFVFLTSVFTHMLPQDVENYLSEIARVMKADGRCLITVFLLNQESIELNNAKMSSQDFRYSFGNYRSTNERTPETAIAYDEGFFQELYSKPGLTIEDPVYYGSWCGRKNALGYQDIVLMRKPGGE